MIMSYGNIRNRDSWDSYLKLNWSK